MIREYKSPYAIKTREEKEEEDAAEAAEAAEKLAEAKAKAKIKKQPLSRPDRPWNQFKNFARNSLKKKKKAFSTISEEELEYLKTNTHFKEREIK